MYESELLDMLNDNYELKLWPNDGRWEAILTCYGYEDKPAAEYHAIDNSPYVAVKMAMQKAGFEVPNV